MNNHGQCAITPLGIYFSECKIASNVYSRVYCQHCLVGGNSRCPRINPCTGTDLGILERWGRDSSERTKKV